MREELRRPPSKWLNDSQNGKKVCSMFFGTGIDEFNPTAGMDVT